MILYQYIGIFLLYFGIDKARSLTLNDKNIIILVFLGSIWTITLMIAGFICARYSFGPLKGKNNFSDVTQYKSDSGIRESALITVVFLFGFAGLYFYVINIGFTNIAIASALNIVETNDSIEKLRSDMGNGFDGKYHWYALFKNHFLQISSVAIFIKYLNSKKFVSGALFVLSFIITAFSMLSATEKGPFMWLLVSYFLAYIMVVNYGRVTIKSGIGIFFITVSTASLLYTYILGTTDLSDTLLSITSRVLIGQIEGLYHYLRIFPAEIDYLWGRSLPNPGNVFPWIPFDVSGEVYRLVNVRHAANGIVGSENTFFWGELYANFSYIGVVLPPFFIGYFLYWLDKQMNKRLWGGFNIAIYVWLVLYLRTLSGTSLFKFIFDINLFIVFLILWPMSYLCRDRARSPIKE